MSSKQLENWSEQEFGSAKLGDIRRTERLVYMGRMAAVRPGGKVTEVFEGKPDREAAFRFVENSKIEQREIAASIHRACAERCAAYSYVFVGVDGTSLNITDRKRTKGLGVVGTRKQGSQGIQVMSALAVSPDGVPLGQCGLEYWARRQRVTPKGSKKCDKRRTEEKETKYWLSVMRQTQASFESVNVETVPWFQLDRGGDAWPVLMQSFEPAQVVTVRATYNRRLWESDDEQHRYLREKLEAAEVMGEYTLDVKAGPSRRARQAKMNVRASEVTLRFFDYSDRSQWPARMFAVLAREVPDAEHDDKPLEWLLLTSFPVESFEDAMLVVYGYSQRWRIEEFHKIWKTGSCRVEDTQLGDFAHIICWATILAAVATRLLRLIYLSRNQPEISASVEFEPSEIKATIMLYKPKGVAKNASPSLGELVLWIAEMGGYMGKSSGGPPGAIVIARGLLRIEVLASVLEDKWNL
jgi:hypothetical protein